MYFFTVEEINLQNVVTVPLEGIPFGHSSNFFTAPSGRTAGGAVLPLLSALAAGTGTQHWQS